MGNKRGLKQLLQKQPLLVLLGLLLGLVSGLLTLLAVMPLLMFWPLMSLVDRPRVTVVGGLGLIRRLGLLLLNSLKGKQIKQKEQRSYTLTDKLVHILPEEYRADLNTLHYRLLIKQKHPKWLVQILTIMCLLDMFRGWLQIKLENIWLSIYQRP